VTEYFFKNIFHKLAKICQEKKKKFAASTLIKLFSEMLKFPIFFLFFKECSNFCEGKLLNFQESSVLLE
jgi:hypothetical protein